MDFRKIKNISVDIVLFGFDGKDINVLLSKRYLNLHNPHYPIIDDWVLTGNHIFKSERLDTAAQRVMHDVSGHDAPFMRQFRTFGNPKRVTKNKDLLWSQSQQIDPRTLSVGYYALTHCSDFEIQDPNYQWFPINALPELGFDHQYIIEMAFKYVKEIINVSPIIYHLLPIKFTLNSLLSVYETIFDITIDNRNFRKKMISKPYIVQLDEKERQPNSKKPANLYMFSKDIYRHMITEKPRIII